jgi:hypothetical protein
MGREQELLEASKDIRLMVWMLEDQARKLPKAIEYIGRFNKAISAYSPPHTVEED